MKVAVACDHAGFSLKDVVIQTIIDTGNDPLDLGTNSAERVDFPDFAEIGSRAVQDGKADRAILMCGSGVGVCIAANKMKGIYASVCHDSYSARQGVEHDDMNVLCLGGKVIGIELAKELVSSFLSAKFNGQDNQKRRVAKIKKLESNS
jgi:ribose 5-phosphate isomerase B